MVGGGNSGAQIAADRALDGDVEVTWVTRRPPRFLPDDIDGRALFDVATALPPPSASLEPGDPHRALDQGRGDTGGVASLGDIVAVPPVRAARDAGRLSARRMFAQLTATGADGPTAAAPAPTRSSGARTGFRPALAHLAPLDLRGRRGHIPTDGTRALGEPRLHLLGHGDWTGPASATLIGVGRPARDAARARLRSVDVRQVPGRLRRHLGKRPFGARPFSPLRIRRRPAARAACPSPRARTVRPGSTPRCRAARR